MEAQHTCTSRSRRRAIGAGTSAIACLVLALPVGARAASVDAVADAYSDAAADQSQSSPPPFVSPQILLAPTDPSDGIRLGSGDNAIRIHPDGNAAAGSEVDLPNGASVYRGSDRDVATVVAPTTDGAQIATVSSNRGASESFAYTVDLPDGARIVPDDDGGADILAANGASLATIDPPWAADADGSELPTSYAIQGDRIVQTVDKTGATLPVVADPKIEWHWYWFAKAKLWLTRHETERIYRRREAGAVFSAVSGGVCLLLPPPFGWACGVVIAAKYADFNINIRQAHQRHHCLTVLVGASPPKLDFDDGDGKYCVHP